MMMDDLECVVRNESYCYGDVAIDDDDGDDRMQCKYVLNESYCYSFTFLNYLSIAHIPPIE